MGSPCFIMLCTDRTEAECLDRMLFGDRAHQFDLMAGMQAGHFGFLLNMSRDEVIGVFRAEGPAAMNIERDAWAGKFPAQIRVRQVGGLRRIAGASKRLADILDLKVVGRASDVYLAPASKSYGVEVTERVLSLFGGSGDLDGSCRDSK